MSIPNNESEAEILEPGEACVFLRPIIKASEGAPAALYAVPAMRGSNGALLVGDEAIADEWDADNITWVVDKVAEHLETLDFQGETSPLIVPFNAKALANDMGAAAFEESCGRNASQLKDRFIVEAFNFTDDMDLAFLDDLAFLLYEHSPVYLARPTPGWTDFKLLTNCNFQGVSVDMSDLPPDGAASQHLAEFVSNAQANRLPTYVHSIGSPEIAAAAAESAVDYIDLIPSSMD